MNGAEILTAEIGGYSLAAIAVTGAFVREALKKNWVRFSLSCSVTPPDARYPKVPQAPAVAPAAAVPIGDGRRAG